MSSCFSFILWFVTYSATISDSRICSLRLWGDCCMMNWKGFGRKWLCLLEVLPRYLSGSTEWTVKISVGIEGVPAEIRTEHLPNTNQGFNITLAWSVFLSFYFFLSCHSSLLFFVCLSVRWHNTGAPYTKQTERVIHSLFPFQPLSFHEWFLAWLQRGEKRVKLSLCLTNYAPRHGDVWGSGGIDPLFLTSALDGGEWSASHPGRFTRLKIFPGTH
jgi:hypothetical protein